MFFGAEAVRTATGVNHFPEITQLQNEVAQAIIHEMSPDLKAAYKWSDVENGNADLRMFRRAAIIGMLTGLTRNSEHTACSPETVGPCIVSFLNEMGTKYGFADQFAHSEAQPFLLTDPYAPKDDWKKLPKSYYAPGQGLVFHHTGWDVSGGKDHTLAGFHFPSRQYSHRNLALERQVDHHVAYFGNFQIYRKGEWAITHPLDYGGPTQWGTGTNTMLTAGLPSVFVSELEVKGATAYEAGSNGSYLYYAGTIAGSTLAEGDWNPPPTFLHEATRSFLYLPSTDGTADSLVIYDRNNAKDPRSLPSGLANYRDVRLRVENALSPAYRPGIKQWLIHSLTESVQDSKGISWTTAGGQQVRVDTHLPEQRRVLGINLATAWPKEWPYPFAEDQRWQTRIIYTGTDQYATFLNVIHVHDTGVTPSSLLLRSTDTAAAEGTLISRPNHNDVLAMFSARRGQDLVQPTSAVCAGKIPGECESGDWTLAAGNHDRAAKARILTQGYTVNLRSSSSQTDVFMADLDAARNWRLTVDGTTILLKVSDQGLGRATIAGAGDHTMVLSVVN